MTPAPNDPNWPIVLPNDDGIRPAGRPDECFYCRRCVGQPHRADCVTIRKLVEVEATVRYTVEVPHDSSPQEIEFKYNESSWCADNILIDIEGHIKRNEEEGGDCLCGSCKVRFVRIVDESPRQTIDLRPVKRRGGTDDTNN